MKDTETVTLDEILNKAIAVKVSKDAPNIDGTVVEVRLQFQEQAKAAIIKLFEQTNKYQTYIYKQNHPRLEAKGVEIWGIRIAYQGQTIYGDTASSESEAQEKLAKELQALSNNGKVE